MFKMGNNYHCVISTGRSDENSQIHSVVTPSVPFHFVALHSSPLKGDSTFWLASLLNSNKFKNRFQEKRNLWIICLW